MIYTVTLNPAIDYSIDVSGMNIGKINSFNSPMYSAGGKGVNVSIMLSGLKMENTAVGIAGGFSGNEIISILKTNNCNPRFVILEQGHSRINIKINSENGLETDFNGTGPLVSDDDIQKVCLLLNDIKQGDYLVLSGSIPDGAQSNVYSQIWESINSIGVKLVVDAKKDILLPALRYEPFLVKPNKEELGEIFDTQIVSVSDAAEYGKKLKAMGARNVLVSMGEGGAVLLDENGKIYHIKAVTGKKVSTVGAGDSMIAGFIYGYIIYGKYKDALMWGTAAGAATAFTKGIAKGEKVAEIKALINDSFFSELIT